LKFRLWSYEPLVTDIAVIVNTVGTNLNSLKRLFNSLTYDKQGLEFNVIIACETNGDEILSLLKKYGLHGYVLQTRFYNRCRTANAALRFAKGIGTRYAVILEDDLALRNLSLKRIVDRLKNEEREVACVCGFSIAAFGSEAIIHSRSLIVRLLRTLRIHYSALYRKNIKVFSLFVGCKLEPLIEVGGFDSSMEEPVVAEDYELALRLQRAGFKVLCEPRAQAYHYTKHFTKRAVRAYKDLRYLEKYLENEVYAFSKHRELLGLLEVLTHALYNSFLTPLAIVKVSRQPIHVYIKLLPHSIRGSMIGLLRGLIWSSRQLLTYRQSYSS